jgi:hypothetical protein
MGEDIGPPGDGSSVGCQILPTLEEVEPTVWRRFVVAGDLQARASLSGRFSKPQ